MILCSLCQIVSIVDDEVFKVKAELFNGATAADGYADMSAVDIRVGLSMGRMRAIFLNKFVMRLLVSYVTAVRC